MSKLDKTKSHVGQQAAENQNKNITSANAPSGGCFCKQNIWYHIQYSSISKYLLIRGRRCGGDR